MVMRPSSWQSKLMRASIEFELTRRHAGIYKDMLSEQSMKQPKDMLSEQLIEQPTDMPIMPKEQPGALVSHASCPSSRPAS